MGEESKVMTKEQIKELREKYAFGFIDAAIIKAFPDEKQRKLIRIGAIYALGQVLGLPTEYRNAKFAKEIFVERTVN